jgi:hypothetical protein
MQVPSLTGPGLSKPINGSKDCCDWLCTQYPKLLPVEHKETIDGLLAKFRDFHAMALSFPKGTSPPPNVAEEMLKRDDLSPSYRKALEFKRDL